MAIGVTALVQYTGRPTTPYLMYGHVVWNDQMLSGTRLEVTNQNTGYTETIVTDGDGYYQIDTGNWLTSAAGRVPVQFGDTIIIKVTDGCGTGDTCTKSFVALSGDYENWAEIDFSLTGTLSCPPVSCSPCNCGGGGSGCYINQVTEEKCADAFPCTAKTCPEDTTPFLNCDSCCEGSTNCQPEECPPVKDCEVIPCEDKECPGGNGIMAWVISTIAALIMGGIGFAIGKNN